MKILFVHQNFPGQFPYLSAELQRRGHDCLALTDSTNNRRSPIKVVKYRHSSPKPIPAETRLGRNYTQMSDRGVSAARACAQLKAKGYTPDVILGHSGWGETLFLKEVWPEAKLLVYAEFYYRGVGRDVGFDPEFSESNLDQIMIAQSRAAHLGMSMLHADAAVSPTHWQASTFPPSIRPMIEVIFDGVNTARVRPDPAAQFVVPGGPTLRAGDEVLTFVNRNLEPYRGYHIFMRALPDVLAARPNAQVVIVGGSDVSYGAAPKAGTWKDIFLDEVRDRIDQSRVHFVGRVNYADFVSLMQVSRVHAYLTYPFVLSWSMLEAMAAGALVVSSKVPPVEEVITDGQNGLLVDFHDIPGWSRTLAEALASPARFQPLRDAGRATMIERYDLDRICLPKLVAYVERFAP